MFVLNCSMGPALRYLCLLSIMWSLTACEANEEAVEDYSNCRYERPEAIFYPGLPQISNHQFHAKGSGSEETFLLSDRISVSILQYGCDYRTQEFIFELEGRSVCDAPASCSREVAQLFQTLARLGPEYHVFRSWSQAIKEVSDQMQFGKNLQLAEGFWVKLDQRENAGSTTLLLTLSENG